MFFKKTKIEIFKEIKITKKRKIIPLRNQNFFRKKTDYFVNLNKPQIFLHKQRKNK